METKADVLLRSLVQYYEANPEALWKVTGVLGTVGSGSGVVAQPQTFHGKTSKSISLRVLDWCVTNYAKRLNVVYPIERNGETRSFNVYLEYRSMLKGYSKKFFDPFSRRTRVLFRGADGRDLHTTLGQLNFFRWAITHGVLDYTIRNAASIERDMLQSTLRHPPPTTPVDADKRSASSSANSLDTATTCHDMPMSPAATTIPNGAPGQRRELSREVREVREVRRELSRAAIRSLTHTTLKLTLRFS